MILSSFKSVGWVAGVGAAALGCYMLSLQVAAERAELAGVEQRIVAARQAIRNLQTELGTRGRLQQLESWNAEVLALSAPAAGQFVENELVLARFETRNNQALGGGAEVRMASAEAAPATPNRAAAPAGATVRQAVATPAATTQPVVRRASLVTGPAPAATPARAESKPAPTRASAAPARPNPARSTPAVAAASARPPATAAARPAATARAGSLLDERTARELGEASRAERRRSAEAQPARSRQPAARN
jgi:hypothetical protein